MTHGLGVRLGAEAAGTALLVGIGTGAIVTAARAGGEPPWVLAVAWFVAVAVPVLLFANVSGSHINPAVTLGLVVAGRFPRREMGPYIVAQVAGAFLASALVLRLLGDTAHLGATLPKDGEVLLVFPLEAIFTAALLASVLGLVGRPRAPTGPVLLLPAAVVGLSTYLIGPWTGSSLNPARSLAPAVLSGDLGGLWAYLLVVPAVAALVGWLGRERRPAQDGPGSSPRSVEEAVERPGRPPREPLSAAPFVERGPMSTPAAAAPPGPSGPTAPSLRDLPFARQASFWGFAVLLVLAIAFYLWWGLSFGVWIDNGVYAVVAALAGFGLAGMWLCLPTPNRPIPSDR